MAYDTIEPCGNVEPTYMLALLCSTVVNTVSAIFAKKDSNHKPITPDVFIPKWADALQSAAESVPDEQSMEEQKKALLSIAKMFGGKVPSKSRTRIPPIKHRKKEVIPK